MREVQGRKASLRLLATGCLSVAGLGAVVAAGVVGWTAVPAWWPPVLAVCVALGERAPSSGGRVRRAGLGEVAVAAALLSAPGPWIVAAVVLGVAAAGTRRPRTRDRWAVDLTRTGAAAGLASAVASGLGGGVLGASLAMTGLWACSTLLLAAAVSLGLGRPWLPLVRTSARESALPTAATASIGVLLAFLATSEPWLLPTLVAPLALLHSARGQQRRRRAQASLAVALASRRAEDQPRSFEQAAEAVVTGTARLLGGADVELVVLSGADPEVYSGNELGEGRVRRGGADVLDTGWVARTLAASGVRCGRDERGPWLRVLLGTPDAPVAVLQARRGVQGTLFRRAETRLAEVVAAQGALRLTASPPGAEPAEHVVLSGLAAASAPALQVMRSSTDRLARLTQGTGALDEIVDELQLVERAVASLLGALAQAAEPAASGRAAPLPRESAEARQDTRWTTTGVLG